MAATLCATKETKILKLTKEEFENEQYSTSIISSMTMENGTIVALCLSSSELVYVIVRN